MKSGFDIETAFEAELRRWCALPDSIVCTIRRLALDMPRLSEGDWYGRYLAALRRATERLQRLEPDALAAWLALNPMPQDRRRTWWDSISQQRPEPRPEVVAWQASIEAQVRRLLLEQP